MGFLGQQIADAARVAGVAGAAQAAASVDLAEIQAPIRDRLSAVTSEIKRIISSDFDTISDVGDYLLLMRGKLFRPTLLLLVSELEERKRGDADVTMAAVVELVHLATLVHDDAVDHSALRRGLPTVNALWTHQVAIIMGDYLYSRAVSALARLGNLDAVVVMADAANEMSAGEMRQLTSFDALTFSEADYYRLIGAKTASLMSAACELGALGNPHRDALAAFGRNLGMAFQIADDLLDYTGTEDVTGKPSGHDLRERKVTLPLVGALERVTPAELVEIRRFFTRIDPGEDEIARIVEIVTLRGGLEYAQGRAAHYAERAEASLEGLPENEVLDALRSAVRYAVARSR
jgi:octaprenyl-diphosphate synthase